MSRSSPVLGTAALQNPATTRLNITASTCSQLSIFKDVMREYRKLDDSIVIRMNRNNALFQDSARNRPSPRSRPANPSNSGSNEGNNETEACLYFWKQLVANWKSRTEIIDYCAQVVDSQLHEKENTLNEILNSKMSTNTGLLSPPKVDGEIWRGPTNDFYRPVERPVSTSQPPNSVDGSQPSAQVKAQQSAQELQEEQRRQRDREKDARYALWEERVKRDQMANEKTVEAIVRVRSYDAFRSRCKFFEPPIDDAEATEWWGRVGNTRTSRT
ncbi:hypothetical protein CPB86DRAFT_762381 [Serendipita vermifera]|nr:hypothetical protein CPB86DRAFT_762381 [Serendipita vermifera]